MAMLLVKQLAYKNLTDNESDEKLHEEIIEIYNEDINKIRHQQFDNGNIVSLKRKFSRNNEIGSPCYESITIWKSSEAYLNFVKSNTDRLFLKKRFEDEGFTLETTIKQISDKMAEIKRK